MGWQRFNRTSNVFEVSDNNGATWQTLVIAAAGLAVSTPPNLAFTNVGNIFTVGNQSIAAAANTLAVKIGGANNQPALRPEAAADTLGVVTGDNARFAAVNALSFYSSAGGNSLADLTVRGAMAVGGGATFQGAINVAGASEFNASAFTGTASLQTRGVIYPGRIDITNGPGSIQASWYLGSHGSYGLYVNTNIYAAGYLQAAQGLYDFGRGVPAGNWTAFTPSMWDCTITTNYKCVYMLIGHTLWMSCYVGVTTGSGGASLAFYLPSGTTFAGAGYQATVGMDSLIGPILVQAPAGQNYITLYKNMAATAWEPGRSSIICFTIAVQIQ